jgi:hypothetical protein
MSLARVIPLGGGLRRWPDSVRRLALSLLACWEAARVRLTHQLTRARG